LAEDAASNTFIASMRSEIRCRTRNTLPIPPSPNTSTISYDPTRVPGSQAIDSSLHPSRPTSRQQLRCELSYSYLASTVFCFLVAGSNPVVKDDSFKRVHRGSCRRVFCMWLWHLPSPQNSSKYHSKALVFARFSETYSERELIVSPNSWRVEEVRCRCRGRSP
jgi:hypothetical protein